MAEIIASPRWELVTAADLGISLPDIAEVGLTYAENALLKARAASRATGVTAIADDAGLEIDALGGDPGLRSRRFLGEGTPFSEKMRRILQLMKSVPDDGRSCRFRAAVAVVQPTGEQHLCFGVCEGRIARQARGSFGFGYDPIFFVPDLGRHMAELVPSEKHRISHRGQALACARRVLESVLLSAAQDSTACRADTTGN
jgi:XTP/dITP diphosphohydrolase